MDKIALKENVVHGTNAFPYATYKWDGETRSDVQLHWHDETEIICLKKGKFKFTINMKEYVQEAPALIFVGSSDIHSIDIAKGNVENVVVFNLGMLSFENYDGIQYKVIGPLLDKAIQFPMIITSRDKIWDNVITTYEEIFECAEQKNLSSYLRVKAGLYQMIACLYENGYLTNAGELEEKEAFRIDIMKSVLTHIRSNFSNKITINDLASIAGMNEQYFCRFFKKNIGKTVTEYLNDVRINRASELLTETSDRIIDIAGRCGYDNLGYFIKRFQQSKGMSPSEYRKVNNKSK